MSEIPDTEQMFDLDKLAALVSEATPGPMACSARRNNPIVCGYLVKSAAKPDKSGNRPGTAAAFTSRADAAFYSAAVEAMPHLIEEIRRLGEIKEPKC